MDRCPVTSVTYENVRCEKPAGHGGAHVHGLVEAGNGITVWGLDPVEPWKGD